MPKYIIKHFGGGISDVENYGRRGAFKYGQNLNIRNKRDTLTCNQALKNETPPVGGFAALIDWFLPASDGNVYGGCRNGDILKRSSTGTWTKVYTDANGAILGLAEWGINTDKRHIYWGTTTRLNRKELPGQADWSDANANATWPKTNLTSSTNHMMIPAGGGIGALPILNDETLALVGYDDSYTTEILRFTPGLQGKVLLLRNNNLIIGAVAKNQQFQSNLFVWDGNDTEEVFGFDDNKPLPLQDITGMLDTEIPLLVDGKGQVFYSDFSNQQPLFTFPDNGIVSPGGVAKEEYLALFGVWDNDEKGGIYSYGRKWANGFMALNNEYALDCTEIGAIIKIGDNLLVSYNANGTYGVKSIDPDNKAVAIYESIDLPVPDDKDGPVKWGKITLKMAPLPTGCSVSVKYRMDNTGEFLDANTSNGDTVYNTANGKKAEFLVGDIGDSAEVQVTLTPSGNYTPEIKQVIWEFE